MSDSPKGRSTLRLCETNDLPALQQLFKTHHIKPGSRVLRQSIDLPATPTSNEGSLEGYGALLPAIETVEVPLDMIGQMLTRGSIVGLLVFKATIEKRRLDVLRPFFEKARFSADLDRDKILAKAGLKGETMVSVVKSGIETLEQRKDQKESRNGYRWWPWGKQP
ncbi:hypothetical protein N7492_005149 [Penicillium capsulatum]|uniref:Uncharacterized protein n=1 Tax=Penicillium capsulatum TaxID=69766 RepID=A0A9W9LRE0_9EURO|nr:hypothetical protein N7492_005149 [Penicillium capsulatum]KAJ6135746.1 hypothetical protein N7512_000906 [Penicillium capsulatum]